MPPDNKYLIVIAGPTAVGKTAVAIKIASHFHTEIISADARQFYREMEAGTAKPDQMQMAVVPHHFINTLSIHDMYDAGRYEAEVIALAGKLFANHKTLVLCGGSGLFIHAVLNGLDTFPEVDQSIRSKLTNQLENEGIISLQKMLKQYDPQYYNEADIKNPHRLIRALEVFLQTGKPYSAFRKKEKTQRNFQTIKIGLNINRHELYARINQRVERMMDNGLLEEAKRLYPYKSLPALNTVGYKELFDFLDKRLDLKDAIDKIKKNSRNYAKRQLTWFKKDNEITWFSSEEEGKIIAFLEERIL